MVPLTQVVEVRRSQVPQEIYHKNLQPVMYVLAETAGRPPAEIVLDVQADQGKGDRATAAWRNAAGYTGGGEGRPGAGLRARPARAGGARPCARGRPRNR